MEEIINVPAEKEITEWYPVNGFKSGLKKYGNLYLPNACNNISCIRNMRVRSDDVYIIGFPKSGTTWIEDICWLLQHDLNFQEFIEINHLFRIPFLDIGIKKELLEIRSSPRTFKTHLTLDILPENIDKTAKVVYCVRNPKDCMVSGYHFFRTMTTDQFVGTFEEYCDAFLEGKVSYGPWWEHIDHYINNPNVHVMFYEDLLTNTVDMIKDLAKFLGKSYSDENIKKLAVFTSFDNLKKLSESYQEMMKEINYATDDFNFYRKGQIGNWYTIFTPEISQRFDEVINEKLKYKGKFEYGNPPDNWK